MGESTSITLSLATHGIEALFSGEGDDIIAGTDYDNILSGGEGDDTIRGHGGNDIIFGGEGADELRGGEGYDMIVFRQEEQDKDCAHR